MIAMSGIGDRKLILSAKSAAASSAQSAMVAHWLAALRHYLAVTAAADLLWEVAQMPLYTLWATGTRGEIAFAVVHCTGGDILIATASLVLALVVAGRPEWPVRGFGQVGILAVAFGVAYTVFSEWLNIGVRQSWAYSGLMPVLPIVGIGLTPLLQWVFVPWAALLAARRRGQVASSARLGLDVQ
jgi:hypothetical protein